MQSMQQMWTVRPHYDPNHFTLHVFREGRPLEGDGGGAAAATGGNLASAPFARAALRRCVQCRVLCAVLC